MKYPFILTLLLASSVFAADIAKNVNVNVNQDDDNFDATVTITTSDENGKTTTTEKKAHSQEELDRILAEHELAELEKEVEIERHHSIAELHRAKGELARARHEIKRFKDYDKNISVIVDTDVQKRPLFGFVLDKTKQGIILETVTPDSPAAEAGMKSGDILQSINDNKIDKNASLKEVIQMIGKPKDGEAVKFSVLRGKKRMSFKPKARILSDSDFLKLAGDNNFKIKIIKDAQDHFQDIDMDLGDLKDIAHAYSWSSHSEDPFDDFIFGSHLGQMNLVKLNTELGKYFGTKTGILVVKIDKKNQLNLQSGDVIQSIDGREVTSPSHLMRILKSYNSGDTLNIKIYRDKHKKTLKAVLPDADKLGSLFGEPEQEVEFMVAKQNK